MSVRNAVLLLAVAAPVLSPSVAFDDAGTMQSALLEALATRVTVQQDDGLTVVENERVVSSGETVRTDKSGRGSITYRDGSTVLLDPETELTIEFVRVEGGVLVRMHQL